MLELYYETQGIKSIDTELAQIERIGNRSCIDTFKKRVDFPILKNEILIIIRKSEEIKDEFEILSKKLYQTINEFKFNMEKQAFQKIRYDLLENKKYHNEFIAIHKGKLVDHDKDNIKLAKRVYKKYGYIPIYIDKITEIEKVYKIHSPKKQG